VDAHLVADVVNVRPNDRAKRSRTIRIARTSRELRRRKTRQVVEAASAKGRPRPERQWKQILHRHPSGTPRQPRRQLHPSPRVEATVEASNGLATAVGRPATRANFHGSIQAPAAAQAVQSRRSKVAVAAASTRGSVTETSEETAAFTSAAMAGGIAADV